MDFEQEKQANIEIEDIRKEVLETSAAHEVNSKRKSFPIEVFPPTLQTFIKEHAQSFGIPAEFYAASILAASSGLIGNAVKIKYKQGYTETCALYIALIANSSIGKTPAMKAVFAPIFRIEAELKKKYDRELNDYENDEIATKPKRRDVLLNNVTIEAAEQALTRNPNGLTVWFDELTTWLGSFSNYRNSSSEASWLSLWSNTLSKSTRVGSAERFCENPFVSVLGGITTSNLKKVAQGDRRENGFLQRILLTLCDNAKRQYENDKEPAPEAIKNYEEYIELLNPYKEVDSQENIVETQNPLATEIIEMADNAKALYRKYKDSLTAEIDESDNEVVESILAKFDSHCLRLSLLLHVMHATVGNYCPTRSKVQKSTVQGSIKICQYYKANALRALNIVDKIDNSVTPFEEAIYEKLPPCFKTSEAIKLVIREGMSERTAKRLINNEKLFKRVRPGHYEKMIEMHQKNR